MRKTESVDLRNKPDWFLAVSPHGKVPVITYKQGWVWQAATYVALDRYMDIAVSYKHQVNLTECIAAARAVHKWQSASTLAGYKCRSKWLPGVLGSCTHIAVNRHSGILLSQG